MQSFRTIAVLIALRLIFYFASKMSKSAEFEKTRGPVAATPASFLAFTRCILSVEKVSDAFNEYFLAIVLKKK